MDQLPPPIAYDPTSLPPPITGTFGEAETPELPPPDLPPEVPVFIPAQYPLPEPEPILPFLPPPTLKSRPPSGHRTQATTNSNQSLSHDLPPSDLPPTSVASSVNSPISPLTSPRIAKPLPKPDVPKREKPQLPERILLIVALNRFDLLLLVYNYSH